MTFEEVMEAENDLILTRALMGSGELHVLMGSGPKGPPPYPQK